MVRCRRNRKRREERASAVLPRRSTERGLHRSIGDADAAAAHQYISKFVSDYMGSLGCGSASSTKAQCLLHCNS
jgi:hypothetical protein